MVRVLVVLLREFDALLRLRNRILQLFRGRCLRTNFRISLGLVSLALAEKCIGHLARCLNNAGAIQESKLSISGDFDVYFVLWKVAGLFGLDHAFMR